jgi:acetyl esterase/lipase
MIGGNPMKNLIVAFCAVLAAGCVSAQSGVWQPSAGHVQVPIWPGTPPNARPAKVPEKSSTADNLVAGKPWTAIENVSVPTITVYSPKGRNTGAAVVVFPGGGYEILAIDLEGSEVCDWLVERGITCVLLKYRVPAPRSAPSWGAYPQSPMALEDAQRTLGLVRQHAAELKIDPHKVGVLGFSAGGHLVAAISTHFGARLYPAVDAADHESCRPDFAVAIYPGHLSWGSNGLALNPAVPVTHETPPTFLLQNEDDHVDSVKDSLVYYIALEKAGVPVEMHLYAQGGHAFGLRRTKLPATAWPELVEKWLQAIGIVGDSSSAH